jgi:hypothetical protein
LDLFRARSVPYMSRSAYVAEAAHMLPWSLVVGIAEGEVAAVVVAKTFGGSDWLIAIAAAGPLYARLFSLVWGMVCVGRRKLPVLSWLIGATLLGVTSIALTPQSPWGGWLFVAQMAVVQAFLAGVVTVRSALWKSNYPTHSRGRITARIQVIRAVVSIVGMLVACWLFDRDAAAYRYVYPGVAVFGVLALVLLQKVRVRRERAEMRRSSDDTDVRLSRDVAEPFSLTAVLMPGNVLGQMYRVLREDRRFRRYLIALMFTGTGNLMVIPVIAAIVIRELQWSYVASVSLLRALPLAVMLMALFLWAPFFDRVGVVRFRVAHGACWLLHLVLGTVGTALILRHPEAGSLAAALAVLFYVLNRIMMGVSMGGGALAWYLGHLHFARPAEAEVYMGIHVTLTGVRGLVMPLVGIWLWTQAGIWAWLVATGFSLCGLLLYAAMARDEAAES